MNTSLYRRFGYVLSSIHLNTLLADMNNVSTSVFHNLLTSKFLVGNISFYATLHTILVIYCTLETEESPWSLLDCAILQFTGNEFFTDTFYGGR